MEPALGAGSGFLAARSCARTPAGALIIRRAESSTLPTMNTDAITSSQPITAMTTNFMLEA